MTEHYLNSDDDITTTIMPVAKETPAANVSVSAYAGADSLVSGGNIVVSPASKDRSYNLSVYLLNGPRIATLRGNRGVLKVHVSAKGLYIVDISENGRTQRNILPVY